MTNHKWGGQFGFGSNVRCHLMGLITTIDAPRIHGLTGPGHEHGFREVDRRVEIRGVKMMGSQIWSR